MTGNKELLTHSNTRTALLLIGAKSPDQNSLPGYCSSGRWVATSGPVAAAAAENAHSEGALGSEGAPIPNFRIGYDGILSP